MTILYPPSTPFATHKLPVGDGHTLHIEEHGKKGGLPALFLHGGPGAGCEPYHARFFDPKVYHIILFDQRGCGKSTPHADLTANTTWDLVSDIEKIRSQFNIRKWLVFGGSWGSTLALVYAEKYPERIAALVLRGIFLCREQDIQWFYQFGASQLFPDYWQDFLSVIPDNKHHQMIQAYYEQLTHPDPNTQSRAALAWSLWEGRTATLLPNQQTLEHFGNPHTALSIARIECHYFNHASFLSPNQLLDNADKLQAIPGKMIHGRYDVVCPVDQAFQLKRAWPAAELRIIPDAGHAASEPGTLQALVQATDDFGQTQPELFE